MNDTLKAMSLRDAFRVLKKICGGNLKIARALGVTVGWVDRWGSSGRDGPVMRIPESHWAAVAKLSNKTISVADIGALHERIKK